MPMGFHFYQRDNFELRPKRASVKGSLALAPVEQTRSDLEVAAAFDNILDAKMWVEEEQFIRVEGVEHESYERQQHGTVFSGDRFVMVRFPTSYVERFVEQLERFDGVKLTRLCVPLPAMRTVYERLGSEVTGHGINNPDNPRRSKVHAYGSNMHEDPLNAEETANGQFGMIQFRSGNGAVEVYASASVVLYSTRNGELAAAQEAWDIWRTHFASFARPWKRNWRKLYAE